MDSRKRPSIFAIISNVPFQLRLLPVDRLQRSFRRLFKDVEPNLHMMVLEFRGNYGLATLGSCGRRGFHLEWFDLRSVMKDWIFMLGVLILSGFLQKSGGCREGDVISTHSA
ncbi:hypothetical protein AAC387_Pa11g0204 [Persea americana]